MSRRYLWFSMAFLFLIVAGCSGNVNPTGEAYSQGKDIAADSLKEYASYAEIEICNDEIDNDADYRTDCDDSDCYSSRYCSSGTDILEECSDGEDNDMDGAVDCNDADCRVAEQCKAATPKVKSSVCPNQDGNDPNTIQQCINEINSACQAVKGHDLIAITLVHDFKLLYYKNPKGEDIIQEVEPGVFCDTLTGYCSNTDLSWKSGNVICPKERLLERMASFTEVKNLQLKEDLIFTCSYCKKKPFWKSIFSGLS